MRLHHVAIQVRDLERARAFYVDVLGLPELRRQPHAVWVDAEGTMLMLERCPGGEREQALEPEPWKSERAGLHLLALAISAGERAAWMEKLTRAGCVIEGETDFTFYVRDPDGTRIGLSSYPVVSRLR